jgi:hypothetical protein
MDERSVLESGRCYAGTSNEEVRDHENRHHNRYSSKDHNDRVLFLYSLRKQKLEHPGHDIKTNHKTDFWDHISSFMNESAKKFQDS